MSRVIFSDSHKPERTKQKIRKYQLFLNHCLSYKTLLLRFYANEVYTHCGNANVLCLRLWLSFWNYSYSLFVFAWLLLLLRQKPQYNDQKKIGKWHTYTHTQSLKYKVKKKRGKKRIHSSSQLSDGVLNLSVKEQEKKTSNRSRYKMACNRQNAPNKYEKWIITQTGFMKWNESFAELYFDGYYDDEARKYVYYIYWEIYESKCQNKTNKKNQHENDSESIYIYIWSTSRCWVHMH